MSLRNDIMRFSVLGFRSDLRIELQAPVLTPSISIQMASASNFRTPLRHNVIVIDEMSSNEPFRLIKSLNLVIVKIKKLIDYFISSFTRISTYMIKILLHEFFFDPIPSGSG